MFFLFFSFIRAPPLPAKEAVATFIEVAAPGLRLGVRRWRVPASGKFPARESFHLDSSGRDFLPVVGDRRVIPAGLLRVRRQGPLRGPGLRHWRRVLSTPAARCPPGLGCRRRCSCASVRGRTPRARPAPVSRS